MANMLNPERKGPTSPNEYIRANHMSSIPKHDNLRDNIDKTINMYFDLIRKNLNNQNGGQTIRFMICTKQYLYRDLMQTVNTELLPGFSVIMRHLSESSPRCNQGL